MCVFVSVCWSVYFSGVCVLKGAVTIGGQGNERKSSDYSQGGERVSKKFDFFSSDETFISVQSQVVLSCSVQQFSQSVIVFLFESLHTSKSSMIFTTPSRS